MSIRFLMCPPRYYGVSYVINPWMEGNRGRIDAERAAQQWSTLHDTLARCAEIELVPPQPDLPDMVFTANAGLVLDNKAVVSCFHHAERQGESPHFHRWFSEHGFDVCELASQLVFEGAGDALYDRDRKLIWAGYGQRTRAAAGVLLHGALGVDTVPLRLIDPHFYHLDTCFCPLDGGSLLYYPAAFDAASRAEIERRVPAAQRIAVSAEDAADFACNAVSIDRLVVLNHASAQLAESLARAGYQLKEVELTEFMKAGGAAKCLTLRLDENSGVQDAQRETGAAVTEERVSRA